MRLRKLALAVGLAGALGADIASALGLGELKLNSTLNQPLDAEIKLLNIKDLSQDEILVNLASREEFQRAGVDRLYFLTGLKFTVDLADPSGPVVRVTTRKPVNEPYLNFLLQTQWPSGNLLREYTLLMDLPTFSDEGVRSIEQPQTQAPTRVTRPQARPQAPVATPEPPARTQPSQTQSTSQTNDYGSDVYGPVGANDTLWEIALTVRPDRRLSVQQTMLAIQRANPEAFINGNINLLRKGQVLRIPSRDEVLDLTARQAISQVAQQNTDWSGNAAGRFGGAQLDGSSRSASTRSASEEAQGRVKLGVDTDSSDYGSGAGSDAGRGEALENELAISLEELDKSHRENSELKSRVTDLEAQIETMERLVEVANNDLRALQLAQQEVTPAEVAEEFVSETPAEPKAAPAVEVNEVEEVAEVVAPKAPAVAKKPAAKKVVRRAPPKEPSLVDMAMDNIIYVAGGLLVLIGGVWMLLRRRNESEAIEEFEEELAPVEEVEESLGSLDFEDDLVDSEVEPEEESVEAVDGDEVSADAETGDVVGEVDIYIAYGKLDQAEQMLLKSLDQDPDQVPVLLKLLEVYAELQSLNSFDEHYGKLQLLGDESANERAAELRTSFEGAEAFAPVADSLNDDLDALLQDDTADLAGSDLAVDDEPEAEVEFDLGEVGADELTSELDVADAAEPSDFSDLDFSLDGELESAGANDSDLSELGLDLSLTDADSVESAQEESEVSLGIDDLDLELGGADSTEDDVESLELDDLDLDLNLSPAEDLGDAESTSDGADSLELDGLDLELSTDDPVSDLDLDLELDGAGSTEEDSAALELDELDLDLSSPESVDDLDLDLGDLGDLGDLELATEDDSSDAGVMGSDLDLSLDDLALDDSDDDVLAEVPELTEGDVSDSAPALDLADESLELDVVDDELDLELDSEGLGLEGLEAGLDELDVDLDPATTEESFDLSFDGEDVPADTSGVQLDDLESADSELDLAELQESPVDDVEDLEVVSDQEVVSDEVAELELDSSEQDFSLDGDEGLELDSDLGADLGTVDLAALDQEMDDFDLDLGELESEVPVVAADLAEPQSEFEVEEPALESAESLAEGEELDGDNLQPESEDDVFAAALPDVSDSDLDLDAFSAEGLEAESADDEMDAELDFLADTDEAATKLDLARAYIDMGDSEGAKDILGEVLQEGDDGQKSEAEELLGRIG